MIKCICFDFDGTLISLVETHYQALNLAIAKVAGEQFCISRQEQDSFYNGLSTKVKLNLLVKNKNLPSELIDDINEEKQKLTIEAINQTINENLKLRNDLIKLKHEGYLIYCASNAMLATVEAGLKKLNILDCFDFIIGNDTIINQKPAPEIYLHCFIKAGIAPSECLVVEDSAHGRRAAQLSGAHLCSVDNETQTTYDHIKSCIDKLPKNKISWHCDNLNILIPMSGAGSRFVAAGYQLPKPLIDVGGKAMIQRVIENINCKANYIFVIQEEHDKKYNVSNLLKLMAPRCEIVKTNKMTEGAACTSLLAKDLINSNKHLLIANSDQFIANWDSSKFFSSMLNNDADGCILTFHKENDPKWSYARCDENNLVLEVAEKKPISNKATIGFYYFNKGSDYVKAAEDMISNDDRVNNEFYICPAYNYLIKDGKKITTHNIDQFYGLGTPHDLEYFLRECSGYL